MPDRSPSRRRFLASAATLVLSHFMPGGYPFVKDEVWFDAVRPYFPAN